jgi:DNA-binding response OmpR family regulator
MSPGSKVHNESPRSGSFHGPLHPRRRRDPAVVAFIIRILREDGHGAFPAHDGQSAIELVYSLRRCDLVISNTMVNGTAGIELIRQLRHDRPSQPIAYIANIGRSTPEIEAQLPPDVPILREPFTAEELRATVAPLLDGREMTRGSHRSL